MGINCFCYEDYVALQSHRSVRAMHRGDRISLLMCFDLRSLKITIRTVFLLISISNQTRFQQYPLKCSTVARKDIETSKQRRALHSPFRLSSSYTGERLPSSCIHPCPFRMNPQAPNRLTEPPNSPSKRNLPPSPPQIIFLEIFAIIFHMKSSLLTHYFLKPPLPIMITRSHFWRVSD